MKSKFSKLYLIPLFGMLFIAVSCDNTSTPTPNVLKGCTDKQALNYNPSATVDDKSCYYVNTTSLPSNAVIELYTGVRSKYGPDAMSQAQAVQNSNPANVVIIAIHTGYDAISKIGWPDYTTAYGKLLADTAGMDQPTISYPGGSVNRYHYSDVPSVSSKKMVAGEKFTVLFKDGFHPAASYWTGKISPVNIGLACYWTESTRKLSVLVEYYYTSAETNVNYLNVALLESGIVGKQITVNTTTGKNDTLTNYVQNYVLRTLITGQWGELITTTMGTKTKKNYEYTVPSTVNIANCNVAAFISRDVSGKKSVILTGKQRKTKN